MPDFLDVRRVIITVETHLEEELLDEIKRLGAKGYTCIYCTGKGRHGVFDDPMMESPLVQVQVIARPSVAVAIMKYMHGAKFKHHPAIAVMDTVTVYADDNFF